jgi:hypothetical protein
MLTPSIPFAASSSCSVVAICLNASTSLVKYSPNIVVGTLSVNAHLVNCSAKNSE